VADWEAMTTPHKWFSCCDRSNSDGVYCDACTRKWLAKLADPSADDLDSYVDFTAPPEGA